MLEQIQTTVGALGALFDGPHATPLRREEGPYFLNISSLKSGRLDLAESDHVSLEDFAKWTRRVTPRENDLLFSYETRLGEAALMPAGVEACLGRRMALLRPDLGLVHPRFLLYFYLSPTFQRTIQKHTIHGATVPRIGLATMADWEVSIPRLPQQRAIAEVLGALDDKIAANDVVVRTQSELMDAWFLAGLARGADDVDLGGVAEFHNRRRVPLSSREREARRGDVPYYGAASRMDFVDEALFDGPLLLVGEDGTVVRGDGSPVTQYVWGPSWVNNHAHVLTGRGISTELLRLAVRQSNVSHLITGAVQPKLSMGNLSTLRLVLPSARGDVEERAQALASLERALVEESRRLAATRDELLPLLMSGKIRVKDAEKATEGVL